MQATTRRPAGGGFLTSDTTPDDVFTREDLSRAQRMFGQIAERFMQTEVLPCEERLYAKDWALTRDLLVAAGELDLLRIDIPEAYGGLGLDKCSSAYVLENIGVMPSFAGSLGAHTTIGTLPIVYFGTEEQKARYLPRLASGEWVGAFALTEPESGSDALAARAKATLDANGTHYVLNGQKMWITNGGFADVFTIFAKVDGERFTAFIVERGMGVVSGREEPKLGLDGTSTTAIVLDDVRVPVENVLGTVGEGHKVAFNILNIGRLKLGARNIGCARRTLATAARYATERRQFGRPIAEFGLIRQKIGEMAVRCYVGDSTVYRTLGDVDRALEAVDETDAKAVLGTIGSFAVECSINKVMTSETLAYVVDEALQIYGGYGYSKDFPAERAYRDARITRLYEGTNEINRLIVPTRLLMGNAGATTFSPDATLRALDFERDAQLAADDLFAAEHNLLSRAKRLCVFALGRAAERFGADLREEQEVLGHIADIAIDVYALESTILRTEKRIASDGESSSAIPIDITRVHATDVADRLAHSAKQAAVALAMDEGERDSLLDAVRRLTHHTPTHTIAARRRISDAVINGSL